MISLALAATVALQGSPATVVLVRGGVAQGVPVWDVEDTTLDAATPNSNLGADAVLSGGPSRTVLLRFGDLSRVVRPDQRVRSATLVLTPTGGDRPALRSASRVLAPWGEGPYQTLGGLIMRPKPKLDDKKDTKLTKDDGPPAARGSATWRQRRAGDSGIAWQQAGAIGPNDASPIEGAKLTAAEKEIRIEGLANAVQAMVDRPLENEGFALSFEAPTEFASSQSTSERPQLVLELEDVAVKRGADLSVVAIERTNGAGKLPSDGDNATFVAHIRNVGDAPSAGFTATWVTDERAGGLQDVAKALAPGEETTLTYQTVYHPDRADHRFQPVTLRIRPKGEDANPRNDALSVQQGAKPVEIAISTQAAAALAANHVSPQDWAQDAVRTFNDVYLAQSHFSFAPEGAKERVAIQRVVVQDVGSVNAATSDGSPRVQVSDMSGTPIEAQRRFLKSLALSLGLVDRSATNLDASLNGLAGRGAADLYPGLLGYGDTRFEGLLPGQVGLAYEPAFEPFPLEATGLLAATDVAMLNAGLGGSALEFPRTILIRAMNEAGTNLSDTELTFFQASEGRIAKDATPAFSVKTATGGTAILPGREGGPFGTLAPNDANGVYLVRATGNGGTAWAWFKSWQALDAASRGSRAAAIVDLRFSLPGAPLEAGTNLASDRIVTDSIGSLPAKLAALNDGQVSSELTLGEKAGDWVEIDLGRDRTVGEVALLTAPGSAWSSFDIVTYATGQRAEEAQMWAREVNAGWAFRNRSETVEGKASVAYHGSPRRFRYLRIINRSGGPGKLAEIRVVPAVVAP